jgi:hypothetical protein
MRLSSVCGLLGDRAKHVGPGPVFCITDQLSYLDPQRTDKKNERQIHLRKEKLKNVRWKSVFWIRLRLDPPAHWLSDYKIKCWDQELGRTDLSGTVLNERGHLVKLGVVELAKVQLGQLECLGQHVQSGGRRLFLLAFGAESVRIPLTLTEIVQCQFKEIPTVRELLPLIFPVSIKIYVAAVIPRFTSTGTYQCCGSAFVSCRSVYGSSQIFRCESGSMLLLNWGNQSKRTKIINIFQHFANSRICYKSDHCRAWKFSLTLFTSYFLKF